MRIIDVEEKLRNAKTPQEREYYTTLKKPIFTEYNQQIEVPDKLHKTAFMIATELGGGNKKTRDNIYDMLINIAIMESTLGKNTGVSGVMGLDNYERLRQIIQRPRPEAPRERELQEYARRIGITGSDFFTEDYKTDWDFATKLMAIEALNKGEKAFLDPNLLDDIYERQNFYNMKINTKLGDTRKEEYKDLFSRRIKGYKRQ